MSTYGNRTDKDLEINGITAIIETEDGDLIGKFQIRRAGGHNVRYSQAMTRAAARLPKSQRFQLSGEHANVSLMRRLQVEAFCNEVLIGWDGVTDESGAPMPFTVDNAIKVMTDLPDVFDELMEEADKASNFRRAAREETEGNSLLDFSGSSGTTSHS